MQIKFSIDPRSSHFSPFITKLCSTEGLVRGVLKEIDSECSYEQALLDKHLNSLSDSEKFKITEMSEQVSLETMKQPLNSGICTHFFRSELFFP